MKAFKFCKAGFALKNTLEGHEKKVYETWLQVQMKPICNKG